MNEEMLETAVEAARRGGLLLVELLPGRRDVRRKGTRDVVTDADVAAEDAILESIRRRFPDSAVVSEEAGAGKARGTHTWVVDPLDGTRNYIRGLPFFAVSVGVLEGQEPVVSAVFDPVRDHMFSALRDAGAWLNGERLRASGAGALDDALLGLDWGRSDSERVTALQIADRALPRCSSLRAMGSAALALAYVAAGWLDGYVSLTVESWDAAGGALAVVEAGGRCTTLQGDPYQAGSGGCVASNGHIHRELLDLL